jgi:hypothetical protein
MCAISIRSLLEDEKLLIAFSAHAPVALILLVPAEFVRTKAIPATS